MNLKWAIEQVRGNKIGHIGTADINSTAVLNGELLFQ